MKTPTDLMEEAYRQFTQETGAELLAMIAHCSPMFFEQLVVDLLLAMGYGGSRREAGEVVGGTGDGGIDGIIKEDRLGLDRIYIQAKRWSGAVGSPEIQRFAGALLVKRAKKGILITTSSFTAKARQCAEKLESTVVLMDGQALVRHLMEYGIGVEKTQSYDIYRVNQDYFSEE